MRRCSNTISFIKLEIFCLVARFSDDLAFVSTRGGLALGQDDFGVLAVSRGLGEGI